MKSRKCNKTGVHPVLAKDLRNPPAKIQRKRTKRMKKVKQEVVATMRKT